MPHNDTSILFFASVAGSVLMGVICIPKAIQDWKLDEGMSPITFILNIGFLFFLTVSVYTAVDKRSAALHYYPTVQQVQENPRVFARYVFWSAADFDPRSRTALMKIYAERVAQDPSHSEVEAFLALERATDRAESLSKLAKSVLQSQK